MIIAIDTEELDKLIKCSNNFDFFSNINFDCHLLLYSARRVQDYFNAYEKELNEYGCLRNPIIIEEDNFIKHLDKRKIRK